MKTLVFADSTTLEVNDESSITSVICDVASFNEVEAISSRFTKENLKKGTLGGSAFSSMIPEGVAAVKTESAVRVTISTRETTQLESMSAQITEIQEPMTEVAGGTI